MGRPAPGEHGSSIQVNGSSIQHLDRGGSKIRKNFHSKGAQQREWSDSYAVVNSKIPEYRVAEDKFASGYLAGLKRNKRLKPYLNMVYKES